MFLLPLLVLLLLLPPQLFFFRCVYVEPLLSYLPLISPSDQVIEFTCGGEKNASSPPGDFASDAQFFVFTGVVSFLATMAILVVYVFFAPIYESENKRPPLYVS